MRGACWGATGIIPVRDIPSENFSSYSGYPISERLPL